MRCLLLVLMLMSSVAHAQPSKPPCQSPSLSCLGGGPNSGSATVTGVTANSTAVLPLFTLPVGAKVRAIYVQNTTANAVTGGVNIGTAVAGAQVASATAIGANAFVVISGSTLLNSTWASTTVPQSLYLTAAIAFNAASLNVEIVWDY